MMEKFNINLDISNLDDFTREYQLIINFKTSLKNDESFILKVST